MKKKLQAAENYLTAQDTSLKEKLEFVKTQGAFFEKAMYPLERQREQCRFIIDNFQRSAMQLPFSALPEENAEEVREWPGLSSLKNTEQLMTQDKMEDLCQSIMQAYFKEASIHLPDVLPKCVIIDFEKGYSFWHEMVSPLNDAVIEMEIFSVNPLESQKDCFEIRWGDRLKGMIFMCDRDGSAIAILRATGDDGKKYFFELEHFSMLYLLREEDKEDEEEVGDENEAIDC